MHGRLKNISQRLKLFLLGTRPILGIDITSTAVKVLEISRVAGVLCVESYGYEPLPLNAMDGAFIKDIDAVAHSIRNIVSQLDTPCQQVALAVPDSAIISKILPFYTGLSDAEMEELIILDAKKYFSYPIDALNFDFEVLGPSQKNPNMLDVLLVAARTAPINNRVAAVKRAGLDALIVDVESYAIERAAQQLTQRFSVNIIAIIEISTASLRLFILHQTKLIYSREELSSESIPNHLPFEKRILLQIKRALHFFYSSNQEGNVEYILLAGDMIRLEGLVSLIQDQLGIPTTFANPFSYMISGKKVSSDSMYHDAPSLMVACGLALRNTH